jgi:hypothetical protein
VPLQPKENIPTVEVPTAVNLLVATLAEVAVELTHPEYMYLFLTEDGV